MRRLVEHSAAAIAFAALMALLIPSSVVPSNPDAMASAITDTHKAIATSPTAATSDGRWKLGGDGSCVFDANDSGPNQCEPPAASPAVEARASSPATSFHRGV